jgi:hypothetical protein
MIKFLPGEIYLASGITLCPWEESHSKKLSLDDSWIYVALIIVFLCGSGFEDLFDVIGDPYDVVAVICSFAEG